MCGSTLTPVLEISRVGSPVQKGGRSLRRVDVCRPKLCVGRNRDSDPQEWQTRFGRGVTVVVSFCRLSPRTVVVSRSGGRTLSDGIQQGLALSATDARARALTRQ